MEGRPNEEPFVSRAGEQSWTTVQPFSPKTESKPTSKPLSPRMRSDSPEKLSPRKCQFSPEQVSPGKGQKDLRQLSPRPAQDTPEQSSPVTRDRRPSEPVSPGATSNPTGSGFSPAVGDLAPTADQSPTATDEPNPARQYLSSMGGIRYTQATVWEQ
ncbi:hypothetical protein N7450_009082 [Penicillium hetheringtonii]|uniref:Uncharacterized protein n=1 Tax=Penicillium hetheringtonii TaxID=911720 RepID=A0AAD6DG25_9EURO|nr:hypothetical protein N7450_009082 [Penicillium hetheringtonii]